MKKIIIKIKNIFLKINKKNRNSKKINNKIISIIGNSRVGKTTFILIISKLLNKNKILIIDCDFKFKEIQKSLYSKNKKYPIKKINNKISVYKDFNKNINKKDFYKEINKIKKYYDLIIFDNNYNNIFFNDILKVSEKILFLIIPELLEINKAKQIVENKIIKNKKIEEKTQIIINKNKINSISKEIIKKLLNLKIIGSVKFNLKINNIKENYKYFNYSNLKNKEIKKIISKI